VIGSVKSLILFNGFVSILLTSALAGGEWSASRPCRFTPGKESLIPIG
jgi:hypothetical protein